MNTNYKENKGGFPKKIKEIKKNTIQSLNDVECFLNDFHNIWKYIKLYKILR